MSNAGVLRVPLRLGRPDRQGTPVAPDPQAPQLSPGVEVLEPQGPDAPWILKDGPDRYFRVSRDLATVARALDGLTPVDELADRLGAPWTPDSVSQAWERLVACDLVGDRAPRGPQGGSSRFKYVPPLTFQLNVLDPSKALAPFGRVLGVVMGRRGFAIQILLALAGIAAMAFRPAEVWAAATTPLSIRSYAAVALGFILATAIHEFGHGAVLARHGGRPSRMGVMLFYLAPAFFCDVSDGWRLPHRWQRVQIACSGITTQAVVGALAAFASMVPALEPIRNELILFAAGAYVGGILNLIPFVKFDGYLALMSHVDVPNLRDKAMTDARQFGAWLLFGARRVPQLPQFSWSVAYGIACIVFPFVIVAQAVNLWATALAQVGILGLLGMVIGLLGAAAVLVRGWRRMLSMAASQGGSRTRMVAVSLIAAAGVGAAATLITVPRTVQGGYFTDTSGVVRFILPGAKGEADLAAGDPVQLFRSGVLGRQPIAEAVIADATTTSRVGPISAVAPVVTSLTTTYPATVVLRTATEPEVRSGIAVWSGPTVPLWQLVVDSYLKPLL
jgi:putative peptide zinc metalloprotease protein